MKHLKKWLSETPRSAKERIALLAGTSVSYLYQIAAGDRDASAALAAEIEKAGGPDRTQVCKACSTCPYVRGCK